MLATVWGLIMFGLCAVRMHLGNMLERSYARYSHVFMLLCFQVEVQKRLYSEFESEQVEVDQMQHVRWYKRRDVTPCHVFWSLQCLRN